MLNLGILVTATYIGFILVLRWGSFGDLAQMPLNNLGDFLAGAFGPLTLFWLILSFILQKSELKQNTKALELQAEELRKSVEQHIQLVETTKEQLSVDREFLEEERTKREYELTPRFAVVGSNWVLKNGGDTNIQYDFSFLNDGAYAIDIGLSTDQDIEPFKKSTYPYVANKGVINVAWVAKTAGDAPQILVITMNYKDVSSKAHTQVFTLTKSSTQHYSLIPNL